MQLKKYEPRYKKGIFDLTKKYGADVAHLEYLLQHSEATILLMFNKKNKLRGFIAGIPKEDDFYVLYCIGKTKEETTEFMKFVKLNLGEKYNSVVIFDHKHKIYHKEEI